MSNRSGILPLSGFPEAPKDGLQYARRNAAWVLNLSGVSISATPPPEPLLPGQLWWDSTTGDTYLWYDDGNSKQWVQQNLSTPPVIIADSPPAGAYNGQIWWDSNSGNTYIRYDDGNSAQWVQQNVGPTSPMDWSGDYTDIDLSTPDYLRRRYVDVGAYAPLDDTQDAHLAIQAAFDDGYGREIVFTNPEGGTRVYRSLSRTSAAALILPTKARIIMEPGATLDFSAWSRSGTVKHYLSAVAPYSSSALAGASSAGATTLTMATGTGVNYRGGRYYYLSSADLFTSEDASRGTKGEWVFATAVSGDVLTLAAKTRDTYTTSPVLNRPDTDWCSVTIEGLNLIGAGKFTGGVVGDRGVRIENGVNCHFRDCTVWNSDQMAIFAQSLLNSSITDCAVGFESSAENSLNSYGVTLVNACENFTVSGCDVQGGKEQYVLSVSGSLQGPTRDILMTGNRARGARRSAFCSHDNHINWRIVDNVIESCEQGVDCRIIDATITGNWFKKLGTFSGSLDCAMQLGSGAGKVVFQGNTVEDAYRGVFMGASVTHEVPPGDIDIIDNDFRFIRGFGVELHNTTGVTTDCGTVTVQGNRIYANGTTSVRGVEIEGKWRPVVKNNDFRNGNGGRAIYLHATANGAGTSGPVGAVVRNNQWDSSFTFPLVQHFSGRLTIEANSQLDATALPPLASATALQLTYSDAVYFVTGTTGISRINYAPNQLGKEVTFLFEGSLTVTHNAAISGVGYPILLNGAVNFAATAGDMLTLVSDGAAWREKARAVI